MQLRLGPAGKDPHPAKCITTDGPGDNYETWARIL